MFSFLATELSALSRGQSVLLLYVKNLCFISISDFWASEEMLILTDQKFLCHHRGRLGLMKDPNN